MTSAYTFEKKKKILDRINKLTQESDFIQIKKIILENNPELDSMTNHNGLFLQFNYLSTATYIELSKYLDKSDKLKLKKLKNEIMETSEVISDDTFTNNGSDKNVSKKLRLTNTESHIINRVKYEKELKKNESMTDVEELHIYDPETSHKKNKISKTTTKTTKIMNSTDTNVTNIDKTDLNISKPDIFVSINEENENKKSTKATKSVKSGKLVKPVGDQNKESTNQIK